MKKVLFLTHNDKDLCRIVELISFDKVIGWFSGGLEHKGYAGPAIIMDLADRDLIYTEEPYKYNCEQIDLAPFKILFEKPEIIELNGQKYLKSDLEEALKHIKPVE